MQTKYRTDGQCDLFTVVRTDVTTTPWERVELSYPPSDFMTAVGRAAYYQRTFDPRSERYDYRVHMCG